MKRLVLVLVLALGAILLISTIGKSLGPGPQAAFDELLGEDPRVTGVEGFIRQGDVYRLQIRFQAPDDWGPAMRYQGFSEVPCAEVNHRIQFSWLRSAAFPPWAPSWIAKPVCYSRFGENAWSPAGRDLLLVDPSGGWAYFDSEGREFDRALRDREEY